VGEKVKIDIPTIKETRKNCSPVQDELHFSYKGAGSTELIAEQVQKLSVLHPLLQQPCHASDQVLQCGILMGTEIQERAGV
jgi:hypothetical protein